MNPGLFRIYLGRLAILKKLKLAVLVNLMVIPVCCLQITNVNSTTIRPRPVQLNGKWEATSGQHRFVILKHRLLDTGVAKHFDQLIRIQSEKMNRDQTKLTIAARQSKRHFVFRFAHQKLIWRRQVLRPTDVVK